METKTALIQRFLNFQVKDFDKLGTILASQLNAIVVGLTSRLALEDENSQKHLENLRVSSKKLLHTVETTYKKAYAAEFDVTELRELVKLQESSAYRKIQDSVKFHEPMGFQEGFEEFQAALKDNPLSPEREAKLQQIFARSNLPTIVTAMYESFLKLGRKGDSPALTSARQEPSYKTQIEKIQIFPYQSFRYALREQSDCVLNDYIEVTELQTWRKHEAVQKKFIPPLMDMAAIAVSPLPAGQK